MKRNTLWLLTCALLACGQPTHAELQLDAGMKGKQIEKNLSPLFDTVVQSYNQEHAVEFGGPFPRKYVSYPNFSGSNFAWTFSGTTYFSNVSAFVPEVHPLEDCKSDPDELAAGNRCDWRRKGYKVCHLFMFNAQHLKLETVSRLNIARNKRELKGLPMCLSVQAMAAAKTVPDAMLVTLGYIDSAEPANKNSDPTEFSTTLLLRFKDDNGKLKIEQDDRCLGNPNNHKTIAAARKALSACSSAR